MTPLTRIDCGVDSVLNLGLPPLPLGQNPTFTDETPLLPIANSAAPWLQEYAALRQEPNWLQGSLSHIANIANIALPTCAGPTSGKQKHNSEHYEANNLASDGPSSDLQSTKEQMSCKNVAKRIREGSGLKSTKEKADGKRWSVAETKELLEALLGTNSVFRELFRTHPNCAYKEVSLLFLSGKHRLIYIRYHTISSTENEHQLLSSLVIIDSLPRIN